MPKTETIQPDTEEQLDELMEVNYLWHGHIWNLLQTNPLFIAHGYYVFENGERWTREELDRWSNSEDKESVVKEALQ